jgi:hypothetical protein
MFDSRDYKKPVTSPPYAASMQSRSPAQRVLNQICPPTPNPYSEEELSYMAAPLTPAEERQAQRERQAKRTKNQRSRQWWNHR